MDFFEMHVFLGAKLSTLKICKKKIQIYRYSDITGNTSLFPLHNEPSLMPVG